MTICTMDKHDGFPDISDIQERSMITGFRLHAAIVFLATLLGINSAHADAQVLQFMEDRWTHALMRQVGDAPAAAPGDAPLGLGKANCVEQRALDRRQRNFARRLGQSLERSGIHVDLLATSEWCRTIETARTLQLRPVRTDAILNPSAPDDADAAERVLELLDGMRRNETALLVTYAGNIKALTGRDVSPGEIVVVRVRPGQDAVVVGTFLLE